METVDPSVERGRRELMWSIGVAVALFVLLSVGAWQRDAGIASVGLLRPLVVLLLGVLAYQGRRLARNLLAVWLVLIALVYGSLAVRYATDAPVAAILLGGAALAWLVTAIRLYRSRHIDAYLTARAPKSVA
jgi:hypothetical protein